MRRRAMNGGAWAAIGGWAALGLLGCTASETAPEAQSAAPAATPVAMPEPKALERAALPIPPGVAALSCDGVLDASDIPARPLSGLVRGEWLEPNMAVARASSFMRTISFDFARMKNIKDDVPCFATGTRLKTSVYYKLNAAQPEAEPMLAPGTYGFDVAAGGVSFTPAGASAPSALSPEEMERKPWRAWYVFEQESGTPMSVNPPAYGVLILDELSVEPRPEKPFSSSGKARGRLAVCFNDQSGSWIAGTFDMPVCR